MKRFNCALFAVCVAAFTGFSFTAGAAEQRRAFAPFQDVYEAGFDTLLGLNPRVASIQPPKPESAPFDKSGEFLSARESPRFMFGPGTNVLGPDWQVKKLVPGGPDLSEEYYIDHDRARPLQYTGASADLTGVIDLFLDLPVFKTVPSAIAPFSKKTSSSAAGKVLPHDLFFDVVRTESKPDRTSYHHRIIFKSASLRNGRLLRSARTPEHFKEFVDTVWHALPNFYWASVKSTRLSSDARFIKYDYQFHYCTNWSASTGQDGRPVPVPRRYYRNAYRFVLEKDSGKVFLIPTTITESGEEKAPCRIVDLSDSVCYLRGTGKMPAEAPAGKKDRKASPGNAEAEKVCSRCCADGGGTWDSQHSCCSGASYDSSVASCLPGYWFRNCSGFY